MEALWASAVVLLLTWASPVNSAEVLSDLSQGQTGKIWFNSADANGPYQMVTKTYKKPVPIFGHLDIPKNVSGKVPAMIVAHGTHGIIEGRETAWAKRMQEMGIATFVINSFWPRGVESAQKDQYSSWYSVSDAFYALKILATHPNIDRNKIGIMGFSRGGIVSLYTAMDRLRSSFIEGDLKFALHVPFYPLCNTKLLGKATGSPILVVIGEKDDWTPASTCVDYTQWLSSQGVEATTLVLPGAHHGFDNPSARSGEFTDYYIAVARECFIDVNLFAPTPIWSHSKTNKVFKTSQEINDYVASCRKYGATNGYSSKATKQSVQAVKGFLSAKGFVR